MADVETLIVGGGLSGICMAIQLLKAGRTSFMVVEKSGEEGGTWSVNQYPGCACDVPSHLYSFSFHPNPSWSKMYADRQEIHAYLRDCAHRHRILPHFRFHTLVQTAAWNAPAALWRVCVQNVLTSEPSTISAKFLVRAVGGLHVPKLPTIDGMEQFAGPSFHSSAWDSNVDLNFILPIAISGVGTIGVRKCIYNLSSLVRWISCKEIDHTSIERMRILSIETVCMMENVFPTSILTIQVHILVHLIDEVAMAGVVSTRWMFYLERFMKILKGFVRQKARPEGSMAEGWLVQESCVWISEYLGRVDKTMPMLWSTKDDDRLTDEVRQGKGLRFRLTEETREKIQSYCIANAVVMEKWRDRYVEARNNDGSLPTMPTQSWIMEAMLAAKSNGETVSDEEFDYAYGCDWHAYKLGAIWSRGRHFRVQHIDHNRTTYDSGVSATFDQETSAGSAQIEKFTYYGHIKEIIGVSF